MEANQKVKKLEFIFAGAMLVLSLIFIFVLIPMETTVSDIETTMQPSVFPQIASVIIGAASVILIIQVCAGKLKPEYMGDGDTNMRRFLVVLAGVLAYILCIKYVGFYTVTLISMVTMQRFYARSKWITAIAVNVLFLIVVYILFEIALQVPMPSGLFI